MRPRSRYFSCPRLPRRSAPTHCPAKFNPRRARRLGAPTSGSGAYHATCCSPSYRADASAKPPLAAAVRNACRSAPTDPLPFPFPTVDNHGPSLRATLGVRRVGVCGGLTFDVRGGCFSCGSHAHAADSGVASHACRASEHVQGLRPWRCVEAGRLPHSVPHGRTTPTLLRAMQFQPFILVMYVYIVARNSLLSLKPAITSNRPRS